jgi:hypothetical protein
MYVYVYTYALPSLPTPTIHHHLSTHIHLLTLHTQVRFRTQLEALSRSYANDNLKPSRYARNLRLQILKARTITYLCGGCRVGEGLVCMWRGPG